MPAVNYLAVLVAAVAAFILGSIWYSPLLFVKAWMAENKMPPPVPGTSNAPSAGLLALAFVSALVSAYALAAILIRPEHHSLIGGIKRGLAVGFCWVAMAFALSYAFERRSLRHWLINAGYYVVQFALMGAILGLMNGVSGITNR